MLISLIVQSEDWVLTQQHLMLKYEATAKYEKQLPKVPGEARPTSES